MQSQLSISREEVSMLLAKISAVDYRLPAESELIGWHEALANNRVTFVEADAARAELIGKVARLQVKDIVTHALENRRSRARLEVQQQWSLEREVSKSRKRGSGRRPNETWSEWAKRVRATGSLDLAS